MDFYERCCCVITLVDAETRNVITKYREEKNKFDVEWRLTPWTKAIYPDCYRENNVFSEQNHRKGGGGSFFNALFVCRFACEKGPKKIENSIQ